MPEFPFTFTLDGLVWEVRLAEIEHCGECQGDECLILIRSSLNYQQKWKTFLHELVHAIYSTREQDGRKLSEEKVVRLIAPALFSLIQANPGLLSGE